MSTIEHRDVSSLARNQCRKRRTIAPENDATRQAPRPSDDESRVVVLAGRKLLEHMENAAARNRARAESLAPAAVPRPEG